LDDIVLHSAGAVVNIYIKISGVHVLGTTTDNAMNLSNVKFVHIDNSLLEVHGPWTGSEANIEKTGVYIRGGSDITLENSEITRVGTGISANADRVKILNNHIHDITHDGIRCTGLVDSLIEGNRIHGLDDGVEDGEESWNKHCDAIHLFISGTSIESAVRPNSYVTIRGNVIYNIESQSVQFNNYYQFPHIHNNNIIFENNIFGPVNAAFIFNDADAVDDLTLRGNTFVYMPGGTTYSSPYTETKRTITCDAFGVRVTPNTTNLKVYNNILVYNWGWPVGTAEIFDYNVVINPAFTDASIGGPNTIPVFTEQFKNASNIDGVIVDNSPAIGAANTEYPAYGFDAYGFTRDSSPDIGAFEAGNVLERAPLLGSIANQTLFEGESLSVSVSVIELDGDPVIINTVGLPSFCSFVDNGDGTGAIAINATASDVGIYSKIQVTASDGKTTVSDTFNITVRAIEANVVKLVGRWALNGNTDAVSGVGGNGTLTGNALFVTDAAEGSQALSVGGGSDSVVIPDTESIRLSDDSSIAFYIKQSVFGGNIISKGFNDGYRLRTLSDGKLQLVLGIPGSGPHAVVGASSTFSIRPNEWQHVAVTLSFDGGFCDVSFYHDFELKSTVQIVIPGIEVGAGDLVIGAGNGEGLEPCVGLIDDVRLYTGVLSASDIANLYLETWSGFVVESGGFVNAVDWIGWLFLYPNSNWVYVYNIKNNVYFPELVGNASGGWAYFRK